MADQSKQDRRGKKGRGSGSSKTTGNVDVVRQPSDTPPVKPTSSKKVDDPLEGTTPRKQLFPPIHKRTAATKGINLDMDPFEVRVRFTQFLGNLNASVTSAQKTAQYAIKFRDMDEDLHNCIIEQLERSGNSMNNRANIMYFLEHLCDMAARENHYDYIRMLQRDVMRIVDAVAPDDGSGATNVKVVRKVLQALQAKSFLLAQTVTEIDEVLKERDTAPDAIGLSSPIAPDEHTPNKSKSAASLQRPDKKQIEQRIEEDRERHKRARENVWAVPKLGTVGSTGNIDDEFDKMWEETSDIGEDDYELYKEEAEERHQCAKDWKDTFKKMHSSSE